MRIFKFVQSGAVVLATAGIVTPMPMIQAAESRAVTGAKAAASTVADISKLKDGSFAGRVVDHTGAVVEKAEVIVRQGNKEVLRGKTDKDGMFAFTDLKQGTYQVSSGTTEGNFRVWNEKAAPPSARKNALLVLAHNGARGQFGGIDESGGYGWGGFPGIDPTILLLTAGVAGGVVLGAISLQKINKIENQVSSLPASP